MTKPTVFAIDFGTSNSLLAAANEHETFAPAPLDPDANDPTVLRSALYFTDLRAPAYFGASALREFAANGFRGRLIRSIKRHLPSASFERTRIGDRTATLEDLIGLFLKTMRERAVRHWDTDVTRVVMGRPARFSEDEGADQLAETRLRGAAARAGFTDITFCPEPVAAAYDFADALTTSRVVLIADLGGGTSDFTLVRMNAGGFAPEDVLAVGGVSVAGDAMDGSLVRAAVAPSFGAGTKYRAPFGANDLEFPQLLVELLCSPADLTLLDRARTLKLVGDIRAGLVDPTDRPKLERFHTVVDDGVGFTLYDAVEGAKRRLSDLADTRIELDYPDVELDLPVTQTVLAAATARAIERILASLDTVLAKAGLQPNDVEVACLTGGTSRMPLVEAAFRKKLPKTDFRHLSSFHSVVQGLARSTLR